jgi:prevent-host-death family protein
MVEVSVLQAKNNLSRLLALVRDGEEVVILKHGKPTARLVAARPSQTAKFGSMKGVFELPEDWDHPFTEEETNRFWEGNL